MATSVLDQIKKWKQREADRAASAPARGNIWHKFLDKQTLRFVGIFLETRGHWIGKSTFGVALRLFDEAVFAEGGALFKQFEISCANWNPYGGKDGMGEYIDGGCVLCKLKSIANEMIKTHKEQLSPKEAKDFEDLVAKCGWARKYNINVIDRASPGRYEIAQLGKECFTAVDEQFQKCGEQFKRDPTSIDGVDIEITRKEVAGEKGKKTKYFASFAFDEKGGIKFAPLTDEEKALKPFELDKYCIRKGDQGVIVENLLPQWRELLEAASDGTSEEPPEEPAAEAAAPKAGAKKPPF